MKKPTRFAMPAAALAAVLLLSGCITHRFIINLGDPPAVEYTLDGDSLDLYDGRIALPADPPWTLTRREREVQPEDSTIVWHLAYRAPLTEVLRHSIAPPETLGTFRTERRWLGLFRVRRLTAEFPSWRVVERYGDEEAFMPPEVDLLEQPGADTALSPEHKARLERLRALGMQKATAQRYLMQVQHMVEGWYLDRGETVDSGVVADGLERFNAVLQAHLLTLRNRDPLEVTLEWYPELRESMALAAAEATGGDPAGFFAAADSIDHRWKSWLDLEDDQVEMMVVLPAAFHRSNADTTMTDTLLWSFTGSSLAEKTRLLVAVGYDPVWWTIIPLAALLGLLVVLGVRRWTRGVVRETGVPAGGDAA